ncbi:MAG: hypothetical protein RIC56_08895 [Pseudomonadales bacterium]
MNHRVLAAFTLGLLLPTGLAVHESHASESGSVRAEVARLVANGEAQTLEIHGTADAGQFKRAWLQIGEGDSPENWKYVGLKLKRPVRDALLSEIPLTEFGSTGVWTVRISVEDKAGTVERATRVVRLN